MKAQEARHKSPDYLKSPKGPNATSRRGSVLRKTLVIHRNSVVFRNTHRVGYGGWGLIADDEASNPWHASLRQCVPQFSADQFIETRPDSVSTMARPAQPQACLGKAFANNLSDVIASFLPSACPT